jgi:hypothetical protein
MLWKAVCYGWCGTDERVMGQWLLALNDQIKDDKKLVRMQMTDSMYVLLLWNRYNCSSNAGYMNT